MEEIIQTTIKTTIEEVNNNSNSIAFNITTITLSALAIIISVWAAIWTTRKNNKLNYKNNLYENVLQDILQKQIPVLIQKSLNADCKKVNENQINKLEKLITKDLRNAILVFKYIDNKFYNKMEETIIKIDDDIVLISTRQNNFDRMYGELIKNIESLYTYVERYLFK